MAITRFFRFEIVFADATPRGVAEAGHVDRRYRLAESPPGRWTVSEDGQVVAITDEQHARLAQRLAALQPPPDATIEPMVAGCDGTWRTVVIHRGDQQPSYRWWGSAPPAWEPLAAIAAYVQQLADIPREQEVQRQRQLLRQFFDHLVARDLPGMMALYHPTIQYRNPFLALRGGEVGAMWRMVWRNLPDLQVTCKASDINSGGAYWLATYTFPPTGRRVEHRLSADFAIADGTITRHVDRFNVQEWAGRAYGAVGGAIGGWPLFERWMAARARARLAPFLREPQNV